MKIYMFLEFFAINNFTSFYILLQEISKIENFFSFRDYYNLHKLLLLLSAWDPDVLHLHFM